MSEHLPQTNYLDPEVLQKLGDLELVARAGCIASHVDYTTVDTSRALDAVLNESFFRRQATINGGSVGART
jgi:hypothetical protein